uniref:Major facilitator superfamily (MFS) profile domain-containing protein n=1 Tax=Acrobeloides nanus TaxID=290746 RepID=A0A914CRI9_9BILA
MLCCCKKRDLENEIPPKELQTHWFSIYCCAAFVFFDAVQYSMVIVSMWPYLNKIDPSATATFFGFIMAAFSLGQAISSPLFGFWMNKVKSVRPPLTISMFTMMLANLTYASIELFPQKDRKYVMLLARFAAGFAAGDVAVMRAYSATASMPKDRPRAVVLSSATYTLGVTFGPAIPVIFSPLGYPGWKIVSNLHIDMVFFKTIFV